MADENPEQESTLNKVARTVGTALGNVASTVNGIVGENESGAAAAPKSPGRTSARRAASGSSPTDARAVHAHQRLKEKRAKHRRKLHRKTRG